MNDRKRLRLIGQGKTEYLNDIAQSYYDDIYRFCRFQTGDAEWAYDLAQETFLRFIRYVDFMEGGSLKGYLLTIAMNVCRDGFKEKGRRSRELSWETSLDEERAAECAEPESHIALQEALLLLPDFQREAIVLHYYYDLKYREIAQMTSSSVSTVKSRIRQGCQKLQKMLEQER